MAAPMMFTFRSCRRFRGFIVDKSTKLSTLKYLTAFRSHQTLTVDDRKRSGNIHTILEEKNLQNKEHKIKGWIKTVRKHKDVTFIHLNDGSCLQNLQVVVDSRRLTDAFNVGCSVEVTGNLVQSQHSSQQSLELQANDITLLGPCDPDDYPFKVKTRHSADYVRQYIHLRPRTNAFGALLRIRNAATMAVHNFFQESGFCNINTPIITANDCEGAGEVFQIEAADSEVLKTKLGLHDEKENQTDEEKNPYFFDTPTFLTVSGQLHLEVANGAISKVYTFGPTFRADHAIGRHHLSEFYMVEAELAFTQKIESIMQVMEDLVKYSTECILTNCEEDVALYHKHVSPGHNAKVSKILQNSFKRLTYTEAVSILQKFNKKFETKVEWGTDFHKEHEHFLVKHCGHIPVFVTDFPASLKPFYARRNEDEKTVAAVDLLVPEVGELIGGSLREERLDILTDRLEEEHLVDTYQWYLDLRRYGAVPHGGFGMGFERLLQCILGISNIRDTIPFPRSTRNCKM